MSVRAIAWAIDQTIDDYGEKLLLICIANYAGDRNECWPSWATLAKNAGMSRSTLARKLARLERKGFISINERFNTTGGRIANLFTLHLDGLKMSPLRGGCQDDADPPSQIDTGGTVSN